MKRFTLIIGILVAANILYAQNRREKVRDRAELKIEEYKVRLNLTDEQVTDLQELREEMKPEFEEIKKNESLSRSDKMRAHADLLDERSTEVEKILDDTQLAEWEEIKKEVKAKRAEHREKRKERNERQGNN